MSAKKKKASAPTRPTKEQIQNRMTLEELAPRQFEALAALARLTVPTGECDVSKITVAEARAVQAELASLVLLGLAVRGDRTSHISMNGLAFAELLWSESERARVVTVKKRRTFVAGAIVDRHVATAITRPASAFARPKRGRRP